MIPKIELASKAEIEKFQLGKLKELLIYVNTHSRFYKRLFQKHAIDIQSINSLQDLRLIPPTTKDDLQRQNDDFICVPNHKIVDYVTTSGTMGNPVTFALTDRDLERLAYNEAISFACAGITDRDVIQLMTTIDRRFMAGLAYFLGARKLGAGVIRVGNGMPELQWDSILKFKPTYVIVVPSFLLKLVDYAKQHNIDLNTTSVKGAICIGEPLRTKAFLPNTLAQQIKKHWDIDLYSTYASTEMSTAFTECEMSQGGHHHPELIIIEVLDDNGNSVEDGELGELTITTLGVEGMPLLRFKTGDMVMKYAKACECGRNTNRLSPVMGRKKQMIKYKGTTLYPPAIQNVLNAFSTIDNYVIEIDTNLLGTDDILLKISTSAPSEAFLNKLKEHFRAKLRVVPLIEFHDKTAIQKLQLSVSSRKPRYIIDNRFSE